jgi:hypothetical protein
MRANGLGPGILCREENIDLQLPGYDVAHLFLAKTRAVLSFTPLTMLQAPAQAVGL